MSRLPATPRDDLAPEHQQAHDDLSAFADKTFGDAFTFKRKDGALVGPFPLFVAAPEAGIGSLEHVGKLSRIPGLSLEARETAILAVGAHFKAPYELYAHTNVALRTTKLSKEAVEGISKGEKPQGMDDECQVAYDVAKYLASTPGALPQKLWDRSVKVLGREGTVALVHYVGMYAYTCIVLNAMDAPVPKDGE